MMLLTRSRSTALPLCSSGSRCWPSPGCAVRDRLQRGRRLGAGSARLRSACTRRSVLAEQRLRADRGTRRRSRKSWKPGSLIASPPPPCRARRCRPRAPPRSALVTSTSLDRADAGAGDPHLLARDEEAAVVEDRPDLVGLALAAGGRCRRRAARRPRAGRRIDGDPPHGAAPGYHVCRSVSQPPADAVEERRRDPCACCEAASRAAHEAGPERVEIASERRGEEVELSADGVTYAGSSSLVPEL